MGDINKAVELAIAIAQDDSHGYDQANRNGPDYDCSSLVATCLANAGFDVDPKSWTGNLRNQLIKCGFVECSAPWQAGDIHLTEGKHTAMSADPLSIVEARLNELGTITGGETGDQTGTEIWIRGYYEYNGAWQYHYRYASKDAPKASIDPWARCQSYLTVINDVIAGLYGTGETRRAALSASGFNPDIVANAINLLYKGVLDEI